VSITERVEDTGRFGRDAVKMVYGEKNEILKLNRRTYQRCIETTHVHSKVAICEAILKMHRENPYATVDEVLGDLQLILVESWNHFKTIDFTKSKMSVEDLIGENFSKFENRDSVVRCDH
jgi:hypothetical protein